MHNEEKTKPNNQPTTNIHSKNKKEKKKNPWKEKPSWEKSEKIYIKPHKTMEFWGSTET